jgi:site-specific recombinase XerD
MAESEIEQFLNHLAVQKKVAASTQNQALSALVFLYREVLGKEIGSMDTLERAKQPQRLPVVLTETEVRHICPSTGKTRSPTLEFYANFLRRSAIVNDLRRLLSGKAGRPSCVSQIQD